MKEHFYDKVYADKDYEAESQAVARIIKKTNTNYKKILDMCCGTGKHLSFLQKEFECSGLDINENMIEVAKSRVSCNFYIGDMKNFVINEKFDVIVCLFGSIAYNLNLQSLYATLENCKKHLNTKGSILIEPFVFKNYLKTGFYTRTVGDVYIESNVKKENNICILEKKYNVNNEIIEKKYELALYDDNEYVSALEDNDFKIEKIHFPEGNFQMLYIGTLND